MSIAQTQAAQASPRSRRAPALRARPWFIAVEFLILVAALAMFLGAIPKVLGFLVILIIGWIIASALAGAVAALLRAVKFNDLAERSGNGRVIAGQRARLRRRTHRVQGLAHPGSRGGLAAPLPPFAAARSAASAGWRVHRPAREAVCTGETSCSRDRCTGWSPSGPATSSTSSSRRLHPSAGDPRATT